MPTVTVAVPVLNEAAHIEACLTAIDSQTYREIVEILVIDGGSTDGTRERAAAWPGVRVLDNPRRIQAAALNMALSEARGELFVRVDGHTVVSHDYVERCVDALAETGAAMVGGALTPAPQSTVGRGIAAALRSPFGAGPARFHTGGEKGWVDTVYMGAYRADLARDLGGYAEVAVNEDAEFAFRMRERGGVWFDGSIHSEYVPRDDLLSLACQFYRYGRGRAATVRRHPRSLAPRQMAPLLVVAGLVSPWRRRVAALYVCGVTVIASRQVPSDSAGAAAMAAAVPTMHASWAAGFIRGMFDW